MIDSQLYNTEKDQSLHTDLPVAVSRQNQVLSDELFKYIEMSLVVMMYEPSTHFAVHGCRRLCMTVQEQYP